MTSFSDIQKKNELNRFLFCLFVHPLLALITIPFFIVNQAISNFLMAEDTKEDPVISYSGYHKHGGQLYWYWNAAKVEQYGLMGYDFHSYDGVPIGFFGFPLSSWLISKIGYKQVLVSGLCLLSCGVLLLSLLSPGVSLYGAVGLTFVILFSNLVWEHIIIGTYEIFGWGLILLGLCSFKIGLPLLAGVLFGVAILVHPGVATLGYIYSSLNLGIQGQPGEVVLSSCYMFVIALFWLMPYLANREKFSRGDLLSANHKKKFGRNRTIQLIVYSLFALSILVHSLSFRTILVLLPIAIIIYDVKFRWTFSPYTLRMFSLVIGIYMLCNYYNPLSCILLIWYAFMHPGFVSLSPYLGDYSYSVQSFRLGSAATSIREIFDFLSSADKIAFETSFYMTTYYNSFFGYILRNERRAVFNTGPAEVYNRKLYKGLTSELGAEDFTQDTCNKLELCGINYIVAYSEAFKNILCSFGFTVFSEKDLTHLIDRTCVHEAYLPSKFYILHKPSKSTVEVLECGAKEMVLSLHGQLPGIIPFQYFPGVKVMQNAAELRIRENSLGYIYIDEEIHQPIKLSYSLKRMYTLSLKKIVSNILMIRKEPVPC